MARDLLSLGISGSSTGGRLPSDGMPLTADLAPLDSDFQTFAARAAELARILTGATGSAIAFREEQGTICRARSGQGSPRIGACVDATSGISKQCLDSGTALTCSDTATDVRINPQAARGLGIRSVAVVPVRSNGEDGEVCGILEVFSDTPGVFTDHHLKTLHHLAVLIGTARNPNGAKPAELVPAPKPEIPPQTAPSIPVAASTSRLEVPAAQAPLPPAPTTPAPQQEELANVAAPVAVPPEGDFPTAVAAQLPPFGAAAQNLTVENFATPKGGFEEPTPPAAKVTPAKVVAETPPLDSDSGPALLLRSDPVHRAFLSNLSVVFAPEPPRSRVRASIPLRWHYVPLDSRIPLTRFFQSVALHVIVIASVAGLAQIWPRSLSLERHRRERIVYYPFSAAAPPVRERNLAARATQPRLPKKVHKPNPAPESQTASAGPDNASPDNASAGSAAQGNNPVERAAAPPSPDVEGVGARNPQLPIAVAVLPPPPDVGSMTGRQLNHSSSAIVAPPPEIGGNYGARTLNRPAAGIIPPSPEARGLADSSGRSVGQLRTDIVPPPPSLNNPAALTYDGPILARPGVRVVAPPPSIPGGARLGSGSSIALGEKPSQIVPPPPSVQDGGTRNRRVGALSGNGSGIVPPPPALEVVGHRNGSNVGSMGSSGKNVVPPPPSIQVVGSRNGSGLGSLAGKGSGIVPPPPNVQGTGGRGGTGFGSFAGTGSGVVPPPPSMQGAGGRGGQGIGTLAGSGSGIVPPPPGMQGVGARGGTGVGALSGAGSGVVPPPPGMQGLGRRGGGLGSMAGSGTGVVPPPPSLGNGNGSGGRGGANGLAGLGSQVVPPPVSLDGGGGNSMGSGRTASLARPAVEVVAPKTDARAADIPANSPPAPAEMPQPTFQNVQLRLIVSAWAPPRSSYFSSFEVFIAQKWLNKETPQLIKLVYEFLPYQRRLSEFGADSWKVRKLRVIRDPKCDESLMQIEWPEGPNGRPGLVQSNNPDLPLPADRDAPLPCYRTTADDYRRAISSH
jgi:hypothetical protein